MATHYTLLGSHQAVVRQSTGSRQVVVMQSSDSCQAVVRQSSGSRQAVIRRSSGSRQAIIRINAYPNLEMGIFRLKSELFQLLHLFFRIRMHPEFFAYL